MKLNLRDFFWLILVAAIICGAWVRDGMHRRQFKSQAEQHRQDVANLNQEWAKTASQLGDEMTRLTGENYHLKKSARDQTSHPKPDTTALPR